jgi:hypothetical protein
MLRCLACAASFTASICSQPLKRPSQRWRRHEQLLLTLRSGDQVDERTKTRLLTGNRIDREQTRRHRAALSVAHHDALIEINFDDEVHRQPSRRVDCHDLPRPTQWLYVTGYSLMQTAWTASISHDCDRQHATRPGHSGRFFVRQVSDRSETVANDATAFYARGVLDKTSISREMPTVHR